MSKTADKYFTSLVAGSVLDPASQKQISFQYLDHTFSINRIYVSKASTNYFVSIFVTTYLHIYCPQYIVLDNESNSSLYLLKS